MREVVVQRQEKLPGGSIKVTTTRIVSPWLRREEAAEYLNVSPAYFDKFSERVCCRFEGRIKIYHTDDLDALFKQEQEAGCASLSID